MAISINLTDDGKGRTFELAVGKFQGEGLTKAAAIRKAIGDFPASHKAWLQGERTPPISDDGRAETYEKAIEGFVAEGKTKAIVHRLATNKFPKSKAAWLYGNQVCV